ncbi:MAG: Lrp/AsnC family transcriptional regulator [Candidatus Aenigmarchaeota archaeon]|nr:Lrp/AsnC family transcriptional regulator [Candidatus Aenigmarchaeota archaeon]
MYELDKKDKDILAELQKNCRQSTRTLGRKLGMPATTVYQRITRMRNRGLIKGFSAILDPEKIGLPTVAMVLVKRYVRKDGKMKSEHIGQALAKLPEVQEAYLVTGEYDALIKVRGKSEKEIGKWVVDTLWNMPEVERTLTLFCFYESKESHILQLK